MKIVMSGRKCDLIRIPHLCTVDTEKNNIKSSRQSFRLKNQIEEVSKSFYGKKNYITFKLTKTMRVTTHNGIEIGIEIVFATF
jgi:hypothetical protein